MLAQLPQAGESFKLALDSDQAQEATATGIVGAVKYGVNRTVDKRRVLTAESAVDRLILASTTTRECAIALVSNEPVAHPPVLSGALVRRIGSLVPDHAPRFIPRVGLV